MQLRVLVLSLIVLGIAMNGIQAQSLSSLKWQKRIIVLMDATGDTKLRNAQLEVFKAVESELQERDLLIFCYDGKQLLNQDLKPSPFKLSGVKDLSYQGLILIGKDGGIKLKAAYPVSPQRIFPLIDSMPMRRAEMKRSGKY